MNMLRKTYFVNKKFQYRIIGYFIALTAAVLTPFWGAFLWFFHKFNQLGVDMGLPQEHAFFRFISAQRMSLSFTFMLITVLVTATMIVAGALISHRIAGPLFKLHRDLQRLNGGEDIKQLSFREDDFFHELCDAINPLVEEVHEHRKSGTKKSA